MHVSPILLLTLAFHIPSSLAEVTVSPYIGTGRAGLRNGHRLTASLSRPSDITVDVSGNMYVSDTSESCIRKITPDGTVSTFIRRYELSDLSMDNFMTPRMAYVTGIVSDSAGNVYVVDKISNSIYNITSDGVVTTVVGGAGYGFTDDPSNTARFDNPYGIAIDTTGNLYVSDEGNNRVKKITPRGVVSTIAGDGVWGDTDGPTNQSRLFFPTGITVDGDGNVFVSDSGNHRIRKITPDGVMSTVAGDGTRGSDDGPASQASFDHPMGITVDTQHNIYVADSGSRLIRKISPDGYVSTVAGNGDRGSRDGPAHDAQFGNPVGIAVGVDGNLYVADQSNHRIRMITGSNDDDDNDNTIPPRPIDYNTEECAICYEIKAEGDAYDYCSLKCGNTFHKRCIDRCMGRREQRKCPLCRSRWVMNKPPVTIPNAT